MLVIPNAINTATILSTRVHLRQSAFRSLINPRSRPCGIKKTGALCAQG